MLQIAKIEHKPQSEDEDWRRFWFPGTVKSIIAFARRAEKLLSETVSRTWMNKDETDYVVEKIQGWETRPPFRGGTSKVGEFGEDVPLASEEFQGELEELTHAVERGGWLFIFRNEIPVAFRGPKRLHHRGMLHYHDDYIQKYFQGLRSRDERLYKKHKSVTLVIPKVSQDWFVEKPPPLLAVKGEAIDGSIPDKATRKEIWDYFYKRWASTEALRLFDPYLSTQEMGNPRLVEVIRGRLDVSKEDPLVVNSLPDVWMGFSEQGLKTWVGKNQTRKDVETQLVRTAEELLGSSGVKGHLVDKKSAAFKDLERSLHDGYLHVIKVSAAAFNPRFMGQRVFEPKKVAHLVIHSALAYLHSEVPTEVPK